MAGESDKVNDLRRQLFVLIEEMAEALRDFTKKTTNLIEQAVSQLKELERRNENGLTTEDDTHDTGCCQSRTSQDARGLGERV